MLFFSPKKRESKARKTILRGVYEDNLRIIGKHPVMLASKTPFFFKKIFLFFSLALITVLGQENTLNLSFSPKTHLTAGVIAQKPSAAVSEPQQVHIEKPANPSDYKAFWEKTEMPLSRMFGLEIQTIMIDPGHGGDDPGTIGKMGTKEKDITLDIANRLNERLKKYGNFNVIMTREQDITLPLNQRVELANLSKADLFVSIHLNYLPSKPLNIIETYYFGPPSDAKTLKLAEQENAGSQYSVSGFKAIIEKIGETLKLQESRKLAASIQKNLFINSKKENENIHNYGIKRAPFVVLLGVDVPAVLSEVSCLSNSEEEMELNNKKHRENIARYLEAGILDYLNKGEKRYESKKYAAR